MKDKRVAVLYGGLSSEREVSLKSGKAVYDGLIRAGFQSVELIDVDEDVSSVILEAAPDVCFIALHGTNGEDGKIQGMLDMMDIPYTGSDCESSMIAFDKVLSKVMFEYHGVPTPSYSSATVEADMPPFLPCVVKPAREGSTIGISIANTEYEYFEAVKIAQKYDDKVLAEKFITGKELTVGILGGECLPVIWIKPKSGFYDFESKYTKGLTEYVFETELSKSETEAVNDAALKAMKALGCSGYGRVDIIWDGRVPYVLEVNTLPGMTETSLLPKAAAKAGIDFPELTEMLLKSAFSKNGV